MPHVYILQLLIHTCNVYLLIGVGCNTCNLLFGWINRGDLYQMHTHTPNIIIGKHFRMWGYMFESMGGGRVGEGLGEVKGNL